MKIHVRKDWNKVIPRSTITYCGLNWNEITDASIDRYGFVYIDFVNVRKEHICKTCYKLSGAKN